MRLLGGDRHAKNAEQSTGGGKRHIATKVGAQASCLWGKQASRLFRPLLQARRPQSPQARCLCSDRPSARASGAFEAKQIYLRSAGGNAAALPPDSAPSANKSDSPRPNRDLWRWKCASRVSNRVFLTVIGVRAAVTTLRSEVIGGFAGVIRLCATARRCFAIVITLRSDVIGLHAAGSRNWAGVIANVRL